MATTPQVTTVVDTPPTPRHAGEASRHPTIRKSTRHTLTRTTRATETPPPDDELHHEPVASKHKGATPDSSAIAPDSPPSSTQSSPGKTTRKDKTSVNASDMDAQDPALDAVSNIPSQNPSNQGQIQRDNTKLDPAHMLPTPVTLPRKKAVPQSAVNAAARVLFPARPDSVEDAMPIPRKYRKSRRQLGFSPYNSMEDDGASSEDRIQIYTDSKDKVPELDRSEDNPFFEQLRQGPPPPEPVQSRPSRKRKHSLDVESNPQIEEAFNREEGMVYVFRGKKIYRKFPRDSDSEREGTPTKTDHLPASEIIDGETATLRPLTRSSIKPRLLFPTPQQRAERDARALEAEEAPTDIEDHDMTQSEEIVTPVKKSLTPATPPTTGHATRSFTKKARDQTMSPSGTEEGGGGGLPAEKRKKISPFDGWARRKAGVATVGKGKKRAADGLEKDEEVGPGKRMRSGVSG